jgi:hypothetical protein
MEEPVTPEELPTGRRRGFVARLNSDYHRPAMIVFLLIVLAHWAEHLTQAAQIWVFGWTRPEAGGVLGLAFPWLVTSEWLHYGYALIMLAGLWLLRTGMTGRARTFWLAALAIQAWHHVEHLLLLGQAVTGNNLFGLAVPTSIVQLVIPRVELHLFYNAVVFLPMVVAMYFHMRPRASELRGMSCTCARQPHPVAA